MKTQPVSCPLKYRSIQFRSGYPSTMLERRPNNQPPSTKATGMTRRNGRAHQRMVTCSPYRCQACARVSLGKGDETT